MLKVTGVLLFVCLVMACDNSSQISKAISVVLVKFKAENGKIRARGILVNNKKQGLWNEFEADGSLYLQCQYLNDTLNGECLGYFSNGNPNITGYYKKGIRDSLWSFYYDNGQVRKKGLFRNDKPAGQWAYFSKNGKQVDSSEFVYLYK
ncbi:hypothetical protein EXU85_22530 [Spirosoma sp. KCTC 42546]|uniref:toxin-antitoxin system YwqK family antitoxin n=1 Tax=Spirosoma sp. KCTC 42546 TaxID=2520506 RepID=UPI00115BA910|nr:hypothetical protein [Spirosoma sp. KCTC 42546]QDK81233.1 hypothetical protein EXU85_22530 [Spirosoma sp. KCTC 42546]